ncbi:hypothetical protein MTO96_036218 [Rhipicephalus appendiculatus]
MEPINVDLEALDVPEVCTVNGPTLEPSVITTMRDRNLTFADEPQGDRPQDSTISVLIGSDHYWRVVTGRVERFTDTLCGVETIFGWVAGSFKECALTSTIMCHRVTSVPLPCYWLVPATGALKSYLETHHTSGAWTPSVLLTDKTKSASTQRSSTFVEQYARVQDATWYR